MFETFISILRFAVSPLKLEVQFTLLPDVMFRNSPFRQRRLFVCLLWLSSKTLFFCRNEASWDLPMETNYILL